MSRAGDSRTKRRTAVLTRQSSLRNSVLFEVLFYLFTQSWVKAYRYFFKGCEIGVLRQETSTCARGLEFALGYVRREGQFFGPVHPGMRAKTLP